MARSASVTARSRKAAPERPVQPPSAAPAPANEGEAPPKPIGRFLSARQFWDLIQRWKVTDAVALELLDYAGKLGASGKRPRFRFSPHQKRITTYLPLIDSAIDAAGEDIDWLHKKNRTRPFEGRTPVAYMVETGMEGMEEVLRILTQQALRRSLKQ